MLIRTQLLHFFFESIVSNHQSNQNLAISELRKRLLLYVKVNAKMSLDDSEDIVQLVLMNCISSIQEGVLTESEKLGSYFIASVKNQIISFHRKKHLEELDYSKEYFQSLSEQIDSLVEQERLDALNDCVEELKPAYKSFIQFWLRFPDTKSEEMAEKFEMKQNTVFTFKRRIIDILAACVGQKLNL